MRPILYSPCNITWLQQKCCQYLYSAKIQDLLTAQPGFGFVLFSSDHAAPILVTDSLQFLIANDQVKTQDLINADLFRSFFSDFNTEPPAVNVAVFSFCQGRYDPKKVDEQFNLVAGGGSALLKKQI